MTEEKRYQVALSLVSGIGPVLAKQLINHLETPKAVFEATKGKVAKVNGMGKKLAALLGNHEQLLREADDILERSAKANIKVHYYKEDDFPERLRLIQDAPIILYSKGEVALNPKKTLGIVGTRRATRYGLQQTEELVRQAKDHIDVIVSGLAYGIDVKSHQEALNQGLPTIGVLACGLDHVYPTQHQKIADKMLAKGGLVSEYPIGIKADARLFPARNRIIAGLSDALVVVEAARKGGALISANLAHGYDKAVFALPGELGKTYSEGCNFLIRNLKASIYTEFRDIVEAMNWDLPEKRDLKNSPELFNALSTEEQRIINILYKNGQKMHLDELSWQCEIPLNKMANMLLQLEFSGHVRQLPGKAYEIC